MPPFQFGVGNQQNVSGGQWFLYRTAPTFFQEIDFTLGAGLVVQGTPSGPQPAISAGALPAGQGAPAHLLTLTISSTGGVKTGQVVVDGSIWGFKPDFRSLVVSAFDQFVTQLEALEGAQLVRGATGLVRSALASALPSTFAESLYFNYGFLPQGGGSPRGYVDLRAGMCLRLDPQVSQLVFPAGPGTGFDSRVNGYVAAGQLRANLVETAAPDGSPRLALDAYLASNVVPQVAPNQGGAGGIVDLQTAATGPTRHLRLCYPAQLPSSDSPGYVGTAQNVALLGADDLASLAVATDAYYAGGPPPAGTVAYFFRGRMLVVPEIPCWISGALTYVPLGTTVRQLVQRVAPFPRLPGLSFSKFPYRRLVADVAAPGTTGLPDYAPVTLTGTLAAPAAVDGYDLPVLAGDALLFALPYA